jgi:hypothetical protein
MTPQIRPSQITGQGMGVKGAKKKDAKKKKGRKNGWGG